MSKIKIERFGGLAGFGSKNSHVHSTGEMDMDELSEEDRKIVEELFLSKSKPENASGRDVFNYRVSRMTANGMESVEASEEEIPSAVRQRMRDELI
jgi:hypothetical protein